MKVLCTIGSQGLSDGRRFFRGDVYEVDDEIASTLILNGYAEECVVEDDTIVDDVVVEDVVAEDITVDDAVVPKASDKPKKRKNNKR